MNKDPKILNMLMNEIQARRHIANLELYRARREADDFTQSLQKFIGVWGIEAGADCGHRKEMEYWLAKVDQWTDRLLELDKAMVSLPCNSDQV
jgi:hypothetical protein